MRRLVFGVLALCTVGPCAEAFSAERESGPTGKIVWVRRVYKERGRSYFDLWTVNADETAYFQVTDDTAREAKPRWSPDGTRIAYLRSEEGKRAYLPWAREVWVVDADGKNKRRIVLLPANGQLRWMGWGKDGRQVVLCLASALDSDYRCFKYRTVAIDVETGDTVTGKDVAAPWDESRWVVVVCDSLKDKVAVRQGDEDTILFERTDKLWDVISSRDGRVLAMLCEDRDTRRTHAEVVDRQGNTLRRVRSVPFCFVDQCTIEWLSEDGGELWLCGRRGPTDMGSYLVRVDTETGEAYDVANVSGAFGLRGTGWNRRRTRGAAVTCDGYVAKFHGMRLYHNHLVVIDREGKETKRLTQEVSLNYDPDWWEPGE